MFNWLKQASPRSTLFSLERGLAALAEKYIPGSIAIGRELGFPHTESRRTLIQNALDTELTQGQRRRGDSVTVTPR